MRIALTIGQLTYGGAESQVFELARGLAGRHDVRVYCLSSALLPYGESLARVGVTVRALPAVAPLDVTRVARLAYWLRRDRIEVAHAFLFIASAYTYLATCLAPGVRFVASARNCKVEPRRLRRAVMRQAFHAADGVVCNSREVARFAEKNYGASSSRIHVVYNGVDAERFGRARVTHAERRIGAVGRIEKQKNIDLFLQAAAGVAARHPETVFSVAGDGTLKKRMVQAARELGLGDRVKFLGAIEDVPAFLATLDQFWLTSDWEGTPNVVLEAMAAGLPVIATAVGGTPEVIEDGRTGLLVAPGSAAAITVASCRLLDDTPHALALGENAREAVRARFSLAAMVTGTEDVYRAVRREAHDV